MKIYFSYAITWIKIAIKNISQSLAAAVPV